MEHGDRGINRAIGVVGVGEIAGADEQLVDDLPAGEDEGLLQNLNAMHK